MISFQDKTFCGMSDICETIECDRLFTEEHHIAACQWWGSEAYPVAMSDFSDTCGKFEATQVVEFNKLREEK